jgi:hypothetical protein
VGADWIRLTENRFRRQIQKQAASQLGADVMFSPEEKTIWRFVCHWLEKTVPLPVGTSLVIVQRAPKSKIGLMHGRDVVAEIRGEGEAAKDLKNLFNDRPDLGRMLQVRISRVGKQTEPFVVEAEIPGKKNVTH